MSVALLWHLVYGWPESRSWQARHTGIKIVQQIAILMGCAILPHLKQMVDIIQHGLQDEQQKVPAESQACRAQRRLLDFYYFESREV